MKSIAWALGFVILLTSLSFGISGGAISGTVKGPDGSGFKGAFIRAQNKTRNITVSVLSDAHGAYRIEDLAAGEYKVQATAIGYKSDPVGDVSVDGAQPVTLDFPLHKGMVRWSDLTIHQGQVLLPNDPGKTVLFTRCESCHGFPTKIASTRRTEDGWQSAIKLMRDTTVGIGDHRITDQNVASVVPYLTRVFGVDSEFPQSPAELPEYEKTKHQFTDEAMKIVYVEYNLPGPNRFPWAAKPDNRGTVWMPFSWTADRIAKLDPETGEVQEFTVPPGAVRTLHVHSVDEAPDGTVWFVESRNCKLGKFNPKTQKFIEYTPSCNQTPGVGLGAEGEGGGGGATSGAVSVHVDRYGKIWAAGMSALWRFDPETEKFMEFPEGKDSYSFELDRKDGNVWFAQLGEGKIGRADIKTLKITRWTPPATKRLAEINKDRPNEIGNTQTYPKSAGPRRITSDSNGNIWFGEWYAGNIGRFDPKTETFKEFPLPGPDPTPYGIGVDANGFVWYSSYDTGVLGRLDPNTGAVVEYPFPYSDDGIRELYPDAAGRMWFGSSFNDVVGYFVLPEWRKTVESKSVPKEMK